jgi:hypothetical protein
VRTTVHGLIAIQQLMARLLGKAEGHATGRNAAAQSHKRNLKIRHVLCFHHLRVHCIACTYLIGLLFLEKNSPGTRLRAQMRIWVRSPAGRICFFSRVQIHSACYQMGTGGALPGGKATGA